MKLTMTGADLHAGAAWASRLCPARPTAPALAGIVLDTTSDDLQLTASDLDTTGRVRVSAFVQEPGKVLVSGRLLADIAKTIAKEDNVALAVDGLSLIVQVGRGKWAMPLLQLEDYPQLPHPGTALGRVAAERFAHELDRVLVAVGDGGAADPMGGSVAIGTEDDGQLCVATTDRFRCAVARIPWTSDGDMPEVLVPAALLKATIGALRGVSGDVAVHSDGHTIAMVTDTHSVTGRLVDLKSIWRAADISPDSEFLTTVRVRTDELSRALERATVGIHADEKVVLRIDADEVGVRPLEGAQTTGEHVAATISFDGEDREVGMRPRYFSDLLGNLEAPTIQIEFAYLRRAMLMLVRGVTDSGEFIPGFHMTQAPMKLGASKPEGSAA